jgi:hypothetical protein
MTTRTAELLAELSLMGITSPDDTLGVVVRQALADDPMATAQDVAAIWREATDDATADRLAEGQ